MTKKDSTYKPPHRARVKKSFKRFLVLKIQELTAERDQLRVHSKLLKELVKGLLAQNQDAWEATLREAVDYLYNGKRVMYRYSPVFREYVINGWDDAVPNNRMEFIHMMGIPYDTFRTWYKKARGYYPRVGKSRSRHTPHLQVEWEVPNVGVNELPPRPPEKESEDAVKPVSSVPRTYLPGDLYEEV